jgi:ribosomal protein L40E
MLNKICPNCGAGNEPDFIRCYWCGAELPEEEPADG